MTTTNTYDEDDPVSSSVLMFEVAGTLEEIPYVGGPLNGQQALRLSSDLPGGTGWWPEYRDDQGAYMEVWDHEEPQETGYQLVSSTKAEDPTIRPENLCYLHLSYPRTRPPTTSTWPGGSPETGNRETSGGVPMTIRSTLALGALPTGVVLN